MPVTERNLRLLVIDHHRVVLLEGKKAPEELRGARRRAAMTMLGIVDPHPEPKPQPELPGTEVPAPVEALPDPPPPPPPGKPQKPPRPRPLARPLPVVPPPALDGKVEYGVGGAAPRKHLKHANYRRAMKAPLTGASALILAKLGGYDAEVPYARLKEDMQPMPEGTVSARLISLVEGGYVAKARKFDGNDRPAMFYQVTAKGMDLLTRPEGIDDAAAQAVVEAVEAATAAGIAIRVLP